MRGWAPLLAEKYTFGKKGLTPDSGVKPFTYIFIVPELQKSELLSRHHQCESAFRRCFRKGR